MYSSVLQAIYNYEYTYVHMFIQKYTTYILCKRHSSDFKAKRIYERLRTFTYTYRHTQTLLKDIEKHSIKCGLMTKEAYKYVGNTFSNVLD